MANVKLVLLVSLLCSIFNYNEACPSECQCPGASEITCDGIDALPSSSELFDSHSQITSVSILNSILITEIPADYFNDLAMLTTIMLSNNGLTTLNLSSFKYLPKLSSIDLSGNTIECDTDIDWLNTWLAASDRNQVTGLCSSGESINDYLGTPDATNLLKFTFKQENFEIQEASEVLKIIVERDKDFNNDVRAKVVSELHGVTDEQFQVLNKLLTIKRDYNREDIRIQIQDDDIVNLEERKVKLTLVPESLTALGKSAALVILDDEVSSTPHGGVSANTTSTPKVDDKPSGSAVWIIIVIIIIIIVVVAVVAVILWTKKSKTQGSTTPAGQQAAYSAVQGEGDKKVYNATTEEIA